MFTSTYLCETSYSEMKYAKDVYRNWLTDSQLDDLLRVAHKYLIFFQYIFKCYTKYTNVFLVFFLISVPFISTCVQDNILKYSMWPKSKKG